MWAGHLEDPKSQGGLWLPTSRNKSAPCKYLVLDKPHGRDTRSNRRIVEAALAARDYGLIHQALGTELTIDVVQAADSSSPAM